MSLIKCKECGMEISDKSTSCIHCGCHIEKTINCPYCGANTNRTYSEIQKMGHSMVCSNCHKTVQVTTANEEIEFKQQRIDIPHCPICNSTNIHKIPGTERAVSVIGLGLFSKKINKSFKCNNCGGTF